MTIVSRPARIAANLAVVQTRLETVACRRLANVYGQHIDAHEGIPSLGGFDLSSLGPILSEVILYEVDEDAVRFRVIGEECKRRFNGVQPGQNYLDFVQPVRREQARRSFVNMLEHRCAMAVRNLQVLSSGVQVLCEALGVPLRSTDRQETPDRLLFTDCVLRENVGWSDAGVRISYSSPAERCYIDLGFGVPETHEDLHNADLDDTFDTPRVFDSLGNGLSS